MTRREVRRLIDAHDAVWNGWWPALRALPKSVAHRRVTGSFPSLFATTRHMVDAEIYWQARLENRRRIDIEPPWTTMAQLEAVWRALQKRRLAWLADVNLHGRVQFQADGGYTASVSICECLLHVATHAHFHRGQMVLQCRELGIAPPSRHLLGKFFNEF